MIGKRQRCVRICAAALLSCTVVACRTAQAAGPAAPLASPPVGVAKESHSAASPETKESGPVAVAVPMPARVLVMPSGRAYLVLRVGGEQRDGVATCDVLYLAGDDAAALTRPETQEHLVAVAREFLPAFAPIAEAASLARLSVTAMFGRPGGRATVQRLWFAREPAGWRAEPDGIERASAEFPPIGVSLVRDPDEELGARRAAAEFISDSDRADYDAAWAKASAIVKAAISRTEFERILAGRLRSSGDEDGDLYIAFSPPLERFLPGANIEAWVARRMTSGPIVEALALRLDDDMEWRVAAALQLTRTPAPTAAVGQARIPGLESTAR